VDRARILVVDDEQGMCEFLHYLLEGEGYEVEHLGSGVEALKRLEETSFHLVLADIKMPGIDGLELLRRIKESNEHLVVILMTGYGSLETAIRAIKYDCYDYILKPFDDPDVVLAAVERGLAEGKERAAEPRSP